MDNHMQKINEDKAKDTAMQHFGGMFVNTGLDPGWTTFRFERAKHIIASHKGAVKTFNQNILDTSIAKNKSSFRAVKRTAFGTCKPFLKS